MGINKKQRHLVVKKKKTEKKSLCNQKEVLYIIEHGLKRKWWTECTQIIKGYLK